MGATAELGGNQDYPARVGYTGREIARDGLGGADPGILVPEYANPSVFHPNGYIVLIFPLWQGDLR